MDRTAHVDAVSEASGRTPADIATLLVELGRGLKGWRFYPPGHPRREDLLDRTWRAWLGELTRGGPLDLEIKRGAFRIVGTDTPIGTGRLDDVARNLVIRAVRRVCFHPALDAESFGAFLDTLSMDADALADDGGFEHVFYAEPRRGIQVNDANYAVLSAAVGEGEPSEPARDDLDPGVDDFGDDALELENGMVAGLSSANAEANETTLDLLPEMPSAYDENDRLADLLGEMSECAEGPGYRDLAMEAVRLAAARAEAGDLDAAFEAILVFANHATDDAKRSFSQRETAVECLGQLAVGAVREDLVDRSCGANVDASLRATDALMQIGETAASFVLDRLEAESHPERRTRLAGLLIAMGEGAVPALADAIVQGSPQRQRAALRLAGETQNPRFVDSLQHAFLCEPAAIGREAARALVRIGDVAAFEALLEGLNTPRPEIAALAAYSLGTTGRALCVAPLIECLARSLQSGRLDLAREVVRGLGRLGRPESVPALASVLSRGGMLRRRRLRELKLASIAALGHLPGADAEETLRRAGRNRDSRLRAAARQTLERRAHGEGQ